MVDPLTLVPVIVLPLHLVSSSQPPPGQDRLSGLRGELGKAALPMSREQLNAPGQPLSDRCCTFIGLTGPTGMRSDYPDNAAGLAVRGLL